MSSELEKVLLEQNNALKEQIELLKETNSLRRSIIDMLTKKNDALKVRIRELAYSATKQRLRADAEQERADDKEKKDGEEKTDNANTSTGEPRESQEV